MVFVVYFKYCKYSLQYPALQEILMLLLCLRDFIYPLQYAATTGNSAVAAALKRLYITTAIYNTTGGFYMSKKKWYEWLLIIVYIAMVILCIVLNFFAGQHEGIANILVNAAMFAIVAVIFISCDINSFCPVNDMIDDLEKASEKIRKDALNSHQYLYEPYKNSQVSLFRDGRLKELFQDYIFELNRKAEAKKAYYKCDIEDYINGDLVDTVMHRNQLNQVAGALTGLGILGTFIGLSLGLQSFNTGSTAEITNSISPLMNGIKVAFHTSIYGMVFSLMFNYVYKRKLYEAESAVHEFTAAFKKFVLPDTSNDGTNRMIELQEEQVKAIRSMTENMAEELNKLIKPQFADLNSTITDFSNMATRNQTEALGAVVNEFINQMNASLGDSFSRLSASVDRQYQSQLQNEQAMQALLNETGARLGDLDEINKQTARLISAYNSYTQSVQTIQIEISSSISNLTRQNEASQTILLQEQQKLKDQEKLFSGLSSSLTQLSRELGNANIKNEECMGDLTAALDDLRETVEKLAIKSRRSGLN